MRLKWIVLLVLQNSFGYQRIIRGHTRYKRSPLTEEFLDNFFSKKVAQENGQPPWFSLPIRVYISPDWTDKFGLSEGKFKARQVMHHVKQLFADPSLDTRIKLEVYKTSFHLTNHSLIPTYDNFHRLEDFVEAFPGGGGVIVYLTLTALPLGPDGIATSSSICNHGGEQPFSMAKWHLNPSRTARIVAHEIGHNLGMFHDFENSSASGRKRTCGPRRRNSGAHSDIMSYGGTTNKWSPCSNEDFRSFFSQVEKDKPFCLKGEHEGS